MSGSLRPRAAAMAARVGLEAGVLVGEAEAGRVRAAVEAALLPRDAALADDHDPRLLHPARTVLILLSDAGCRSVAVLAAAAFCESVDGALAADPAALRTIAGDGAYDIACSVPLPAGDDDELLLERLVTAPAGAALVALAERLDQARHLHLRPDLGWRPLHAGVERAYVPAARRLCPPLARRFERWAEAFGRRLLLRPQQP